jgi:hypothetical protein
MTLLTDGLMIAAALFAAIYCFVLSRRLRALKDLDSGIGGAIMRMTRSLEDARRALEEAKTANRDGNKELKDLIVRAEAASGQLRILLSATRDLPAERDQARTPAKPAQHRTHAEEEASETVAPPRNRRPVADRREPLPLAAPRAPAPALEPLDRDQHRAPSPLRSRPAHATPSAAVPVPANEDELLAALADLAGARS